MIFLIRVLGIELRSECTLQTGMRFRVIQGIIITQDKLALAVACTENCEQISKKAFGQVRKNLLSSHAISFNLSMSKREFKV